MSPFPVCRVLLVGAALALSVACSTPSQGGGAAAPAAGDGRPKPGGILRMDMDREAQNFNPMLKEGGVQEAALGGVYTPLLRLEFSQAVGYTGTKLLPNMAESWEVSADATTYSFKLRKDLKCQNKPPVNGRAITSEDIKYNLVRFRDEKISMAKFIVEDITDVQTPDPYTVKVTMRQPFVPFLPYMAWDKSLFHPKELDETNQLDTNPVGSGPFMLESFTPGSVTKLKRNPDFFLKDKNGTPLPYLDGYEIFKIIDPSTAAAAFISKQVDLCGQCPRGEGPIVERVRAGAPDAQWFTGPETGGISELYIANNKPPFNDVRVRQALRLGLDVNGMIAALTKGKGKLNMAGVSTGYTDWALPEAEVKAFYPYDLAKAKDLMKQAGLDGDALKFTIWVGNNSQSVLTFTELLERQMRAIGFDAKIGVVDFSDIITKRRANDFVMFTSGKSQEIDPDGNLVPVYSTKGELNYSKISDPQLDQMMAKQRTLLDVTERKKLLQDITRRIADQAYSLNPIMDNRLIYWRPYVKGYYPHVYWGFGQKFMETWLDK